MPITLTQYVVNSHKKGDWDITMTFSDASVLNEVIHFGHQHDDPSTASNPQTAQEKLTALVKDYATAYQAGLAVANTPSGTATISLATPILVS